MVTTKLQNKLPINVLIFLLQHMETKLHALLGVAHLEQLKGWGGIPMMNDASYGLICLRQPEQILRHLTLSTWKTKRGRKSFIIYHISL